MSKILQELCAAVKAALPTGVPTPAMLEGLVAQVGKLNDAAWNALSEPAADYFNEAVDAVNAGKEAPPLPDWEAPAPAATTRRRTAAAPAAPAYVVGDDVVVAMKDGTTVTGKVTILDDKGELVLDDGQGEVGVDLNLIASVTPKPAPAPAATSRRRTAAPAQSEPVVLEPEVSDTVEVINNRDKSYMGNIVEIDDSGVVIVTAAGDELPFTREKIKSIVVKVKNAGRGASTPASTTPAADPPATTGRARTRAAAGAAAGTPAGDAPATRSSNRGVSVGTRIRELILDKSGITMEQVGAALKAEGLAFADTSLAMNYKDAHAFLKLLGDRKMLK